MKTKKIKRVKKFKRVMSLIATLVLCMCMLTGIVALADTDGSNGGVTLSSADSAVLTSILNQQGIANLHGYSDTGAAQQVNMFTRTGNCYRFNTDAFKTVPKKEKQSALTSFVNSMNNNTVMTKEGKQSVYDEMRNSSDDAVAMMIPIIYSDTKADLFTALRIFQPFKGTLGTVLGIGVIVIITLLMASTVLDLVYIGNPIARNHILDKTNDNGNGGGGGGNAKPWGISMEAYSVVMEVEGAYGNSGGGGSTKYKNGYGIYLRRRGVTYIILSICVLYLLSGQIVSIISWMMNLVSGFQIGG